MVKGTKRPFGLYEILIRQYADHELEGELEMVSTQINWHESLEHTEFKTISKAIRLVTGFTEKYYNNSNEC